MKKEDVFVILSPQFGLLVAVLIYAGLAHADQAQFRAVWVDPYDKRGIESYNIYLRNEPGEYTNAVVTGISVDANEHIFPVPPGTAYGNVCVVMTSDYGDLGESKHSNETCLVYECKCPPNVTAFEVFDE